VIAARNPVAGRGPRGRDHRAQHGGSVDRRAGVGHRHDLAEAAGSGSGGPRFDVLLVLLAGRAQMDVRVDEPWEQVATLGVERLGTVGRLE
jgi:hypothetical protein